MICSFAGRLMALALLCVSMAVAPSAFAFNDVLSAKIEKPAEGTPVLFVQPNVSLSLLTAAGGQDPKAEWSENARKYLSASLTDLLDQRKYKVSTVDVTTYDSPEAVQLLKLNEAVTTSIALNQLTAYKMPTKSGFDWTLGDGVAALTPQDAASAPAYALFIQVRGTYSSGGRAALMVGMAALGVGMPMGGQVIQATLVDMNTGRIVWYNNLTVPAGTDIRTPEGAAEMANTLAKSLPL